MRKQTGSRREADRKKWILEHSWQRSSKEEWFPRGPSESARERVLCGKAWVPIPTYSLRISGAFRCWKSYKSQSDALWLGLPHLQKPCLSEHFPSSDFSVLLYLPNCPVCLLTVNPCYPPKNLTPSNPKCLTTTVTKRRTTGGEKKNLRKLCWDC